MNKLFEGSQIVLDLEKGPVDTWILMTQKGHQKYGCSTKTRIVVHEYLVVPAVCLSDLYDVFLLDIVGDTRQSLWTLI